MAAHGGCTVGVRETNDLGSAEGGGVFECVSVLTPYRRSVGSVAEGLLDSAYATSVDDAAISRLTSAG